MVPKITIKQVNQSAKRLTLFEDFPAECRECGTRTGATIKSGAELEIVDESGDLILVVNCRNCGKQTGKPRRSISLAVPL
jgi:hypothetical protein